MVPVLRLRLLRDPAQRPRGALRLSAHARAPTRALPPPGNEGILLTDRRLLAYTSDGNKHELVGELPGRSTAKSLIVVPEAWNEDVRVKADQQIALGKTLGRALITEAPDWSTMDEQQMESWWASATSGTYVYYFDDAKKRGASASPRR